MPLELTPKVMPYYDNTTTQGTKRYVALLTQTGTNAPTATILENTIGNIIWTRQATGDYLGTLTGAFTLNKTATLLGQFGGVGYTTDDALEDFVNIQTYSDVGITKADGYLAKTVIQITIYP